MTTGAVGASLIQDAVYDALNVASFTALATGGVWTDVPQGTAYPLAWLTFATPAEEPQDTFGKIGVIEHLELHVYSLYEGDDEALDILSKACELAHHGNLTISGWSVPFVDRQSSDLLIEDFNGRAMRHGVLRIDVHAFKD